MALEMRVRYGISIVLLLISSYGDYLKVRNLHFNSPLVRTEGYASPKIIIILTLGNSVGKKMWNKRRKYFGRNDAVHRTV